MENIDWNQIQESYNSGLSTREIMEKYKINRYDLERARENNQFIPRSLSESAKMAHKMGKTKNSTEWSDERRKKQSELKKKLYKEHPEMHPNRKLCGNYNKLTYPEKLAYTFFSENNIKFSSHEPVKCGDTTFFPDFLLDNKMIIEIDGERWHSSISQKERDENRDTIIKSFGYNIIRIPAKNVIQNLNILFPNTNIDNIDFDELKSKIILIPRKEKEKVFCKDCNKEIKYSKSGYCSKCCQKNNRNIKVKKTKIDMKTGNNIKKCEENKIFLKNGNIILIDELKKMVKEKSMLQIGQIYSVSDNAIRRHCKRYNIEIPKHKGDWVKTVLNESIMTLYKEGKQSNEISIIVGKSVEEVDYIIKKKTKIKMFTPNMNIDKNKIIELYNFGLTQREIASQLNCGRTIVCTTLQKYKNNLN
jgi:very-short-patch-repair endonuclease